MRTWFGAAFAAVVLIASSPIAARAAGYAMPAEQKNDEIVVKAVFEDMQSRGFRAILAARYQLEEVLAHAPATFPVYEKVGADVVIRAQDDDQDGLLAATLEATVTKKARYVFVEYDTYPLAALLLASYANEIGAYEEALRYTDRGLALQPDHPVLTSEKAQALYALRMSSEGLQVVQRWLANNPTASKRDLGRLRRAEGYGLIEIRDLDGAEVAYQKSLEYEPGNALALHELGCIKRLKAGMGCGAGALITSEEAQDSETVKAKLERGLPPAPAVPSK